MAVFSVRPVAADLHLKLMPDARCLAPDAFIILPIKTCSSSFGPVPKSSLFKKPRNHLTALTFSSILPAAQLDDFRSPFSFPPAVLATFTLSSIQRRIHIGNSHSPIFSAAPVLVNISEPEKRLINGSGLLIYSVNGFHFNCLP